MPVPAEVRLHPDAEHELRSAYLWYLERNTTVADSFIADVDHAIEVVGGKPDRWPKLTKPFVVMYFLDFLLYWYTG
jgi:plasmid stabilization system protein ParE